MHAETKSDETINMNDTINTHPQRYKVIILGSANCPHCRALVRLLREVPDIATFSYIELGDFVTNYLSEAEREMYIKKLQANPLGLPLAFIKPIGSDNVGTQSTKDGHDSKSQPIAPKWKQLHAGDHTKNLVLRYAKGLVKHQPSQHSSNQPPKTLKDVRNRDRQAH